MTLLITVASTSGGAVDPNRLLIMVAFSTGGAC